MKQFMKILGIAGIVCCLCGIAMTGIGYAFGGGDYIRAENLADIKNVFFWNTGRDSEEASGDIGDIKADTGNITAGNIQKDDADTIQEEKKGAVSTDSENVKTWKSDDIILHSVNSIKVNLDYIDLIIAVSKDNDFHLLYELHCMNQENPLSYRLENGALTLTEKGFQAPSFRKGFWDMANSINKYDNLITLYVPSDTVLKSCILDVADSDLTIKGLHCNVMDIKTTDGDINIKESIFSETVTKADDGDIAFSDISISGDLQIDTADGDILVSGLNVKGAVQLNTADGDMSLAGLKAYKGMIIDTRDGDISISGLTVSGAAEIIACDGDISISDFTESDGISIQTDYGDITASSLNIEGKMQLYTEDGDVSLSGLGVAGMVTIESVYGDIFVQIQRKSLSKLKITMDTEEGEVFAAHSLGGKNSRGHYERSGSESVHLKGYAEEGDISIQ